MLVGGNAYAWDYSLAGAQSYTPMGSPYEPTL